MRDFKNGLDAQIADRFPLMDLPGGCMCVLEPFLQELIELRDLRGISGPVEIIVGVDG
jgi:hypothetical protein